MSLSSSRDYSRKFWVFPGSRDRPTCKFQGTDLKLEITISSSFLFCAIFPCQTLRLLSFQDRKHLIKVNPPLKITRTSRQKKICWVYFYDSLIDLTDGSAKRVLLCVMKYVFTPRKRKRKPIEVSDQLSNIYEMSFPGCDSEIRFRSKDNPSTPNGTPKYLKLFLFSNSIRWEKFRWENERNFRSGAEKYLIIHLKYKFAQRNVSHSSRINIGS